MLETELVAWALARLSDGDFDRAAYEASEGKELVLHEPELDFERIEFEVCAFLVEDIDALDNFRTYSNRENLERLLRAHWGIPDTSVAVLLEELNGATYEYCVERIWRECKKLDADSDRLWLRMGKIGGTAMLGKGIRKILVGEPSGQLAECYARELSWLFPKMIKRAQRMVPTKTAQTLPQLLESYLAEAFDCFVYGRAVACLQVCRSIVEISLKYYLFENGKESEAGETDGLNELIHLAEGIGGWRLQTAIGTAKEIRRKCNPVVHPKGIQDLPSMRLCEEVLKKTRYVVNQFNGEIAS
jgi:hypothetical protein